MPVFAPKIIIPSHLAAVPVLLLDLHREWLQKIERVIYQRHRIFFGVMGSLAAFFSDTMKKSWIVEAQNGRTADTQSSVWLTVDL